MMMKMAEKCTDSEMERLFGVGVAPHSKIKSCFYKLSPPLSYKEKKEHGLIAGRTPECATTYIAFGKSLLTGECYMMYISENGCLRDIIVDHESVEEILHEIGYTIKKCSLEELDNW